LSVSRAGRFVKQPAGYTAFVPAPLPPDPPVRMDETMVGAGESVSSPLVGSPFSLDLQGKRLVIVEAWHYVGTDLL